MDMGTLLYSKWITNKDLLISTGNCTMLCGRLDGRRVWDRMGTGICMTKSLCAAPETITLLISYTPKWASPVAQQVCLQCRKQVQSLGREGPWRRAWQPTPVFLPGEYHGQRSLAGYSPQGHRLQRLSTHACPRAPIYNNTVAF